MVEKSLRNGLVWTRKEWQSPSFRENAAKFFKTLRIYLKHSLKRKLDLRIILFDFDLLRKDLFYV